jgi:hypothetical protein
VNQNEVHIQPRSEAELQNHHKAFGHIMEHILSSQIKMEKFGWYRSSTMRKQALDTFNQFTEPLLFGNDHHTERLALISSKKPGDLRTYRDMWIFEDRLCRIHGAKFESYVQDLMKVKRKYQGRLWLDKYDRNNIQNTFDIIVGGCHGDPEKIIAMISTFEIGPNDSPFAFREGNVCYIIKATLHKTHYLHVKYWEKTLSRMEHMNQIIIVYAVPDYHFDDFVTTHLSFTTLLIGRKYELYTSKFLANLSIFPSQTGV